MQILYIFGIFGTSRGQSFEPVFYFFTLVIDLKMEQKKTSIDMKNLIEKL